MPGPVRSIGLSDYRLRLVECCDLRWSRVCQPPARDTDAAGVVRTLAAYRGAAGPAGVIEVGYAFGEYASCAIPQGMRN